MTTAISIEKLDYFIGEQRIVDSVSFTLDAGNYLSIIGPNGAGKTSLLKCINRIYTATGGDIHVFGKLLRDYTQRELARVLSYVPQANAEYFPFSVIEFVLMGRYPHLSPFTSVGPEDRAIAEEMLERTGTTPFADRAIHTLSGGERQKVFIAAALAQGAKILLLDEPTTFLDYKHQVEVTRLLQKLNREQNVTIVSVTHDVNSAVLTSNDVLALKHGAVAFHGPPEALSQGDQLEKIYGTKFHFVQDTDSGLPIVVPSGDAHE